MQLYKKEVELQTQISLTPRGNIMFEFNKEHIISLYYFW